MLKPGGQNYPLRTRDIGNEKSMEDGRMEGCYPGVEVAIKKTKKGCIIFWNRKSKQSSWETQRKSQEVGRKGLVPSPSSPLKQCGHALSPPLQQCGMWLRLTKMNITIQENRETKVKKQKDTT